MDLTDLISGQFVDREAGELEREVVEVSDEDIRNFVEGRYGRLTSRQLAYLKELEADPLGEKWDERHAHCIFIDPESFFEFLFVNFPAEDSWEKSYQTLRALVGDHPLDWANVLTACN